MVRLPRPLREKVGVRGVLVGLFVVGLAAVAGCKKSDSALTWTRTFGGASSDWGNSVQQTRDSGYVVTGCFGQYGAGEGDLWLIKTDAAGDTVWTRTCGGAHMDWGNAVRQTQDGGYIVAGCTRSVGEDFGTVWLVKFSAEGDTVWTRTFGGTDGEEGTAVQETQDGGYVVTGNTYHFGAGSNDMWLIKTDAGGDSVWTRAYGGADDDRASSVQQTIDGGYIIVGATLSYGAGNWDVWLVKTDSNGLMIWNKTYGGTSYDWGYSVQQTRDGGYIIAGTTYGPGRHNAWLLKVDANGDTVWTRDFDWRNNSEVRSVRQTEDRGYIVSGFTQCVGPGGTDVWLVKTDADGDTIWTRTFGGDRDEWGNCVQQAQDGGYIVTGFTMSYGAGRDDVWLVKTGPNGEVDEGGGN